MAEVTATQPQTAAPTPVPVKKKGPGKKKMVKRLIALGVAAAVLGGGGFALYKFLNSSSLEEGEIFAQEATIGTIPRTNAPICTPVSWQAKIMEE